MRVRNDTQDIAMHLKPLILATTCSLAALPAAAQKENFAEFIKRCLYCVLGKLLVRRFIPVARSVFARYQIGNIGFIMTRWDTDADGRVTVQEVSERRRDLFIAFDENEDGLLDAAEYTPFNEGQESGTSIIERSSGQANGGKRNGSDMSMIAMDADHNGTVTETEFLAGSARTEMGTASLLMRILTGSSGVGIICWRILGGIQNPGRIPTRRYRGMGKLCTVNHQTQRWQYAIVIDE